MTTLYRPVLIESAEQAEALPIGTVATHAKGSGMDHAHKLFPPLGHTESLLWASLTGLVSNAGMVGWMALVPIEAEEETRSVARHPGGGQTNYNTEAAGNPGRMGEYIASLPVESRYVTPWEEA